MFAVSGFLRVLISSDVSPRIVGSVVRTAPEKFQVLSWSGSLAAVLTFWFLMVCWIIQPVIRTFLVSGISLSLPVTLSSDFWRTEQVSKIMISASAIVSTGSKPQFLRTDLILAVSE